MPLARQLPCPGSASALPPLTWALRSGRTIMSSHGVDGVTCVQVIDLISLKPFDMETISKSIKKTRNCIIVEECMKTGGIGASLSAMVNESLFDELDHQARTSSSIDVCYLTCWFAAEVKGIAVLLFTIINSPPALRALDLHVIYGSEQGAHKLLQLCKHWSVAAIAHVA